MEIREYEDEISKYENAGLKNEDEILECQDEEPGYEEGSEYEDMSLGNEDGISEYENEEPEYETAASAWKKAEKSKKFDLIITDSAHAAQILEENKIFYEGNIELDKIGFCKIETQQACITGSFCIPKLLNIQEGRYRILFFITRDKIVLVDDESFSEKLVDRINRRKAPRYKTKEIFLFDFIAEFINRDLEQLVLFEKRLMKLEEAVHTGHMENFQSDILSVRRDLLVLRGYYDEIMDVGKALEENENRYFLKKHLKYFGTISDRAERLMNKTSHLLEYAGQVNDAYQAKVDARQNSNMQFLTVISTIFFPLTLITGWYGMNFQNMPELADGYPGVIALSVIVIIICIVLFKIKKIF